MTDRAKLVVPALPAPTGPNPQKARFFAEVSSAFEVLSLFYSLNAEEQEEFIETAKGLAARAYAREAKK